MQFKLNQTQCRVSYKACKIIPYFQVKIKWVNFIPVYVRVTFCKFQNQKLAINTTSVQFRSVAKSCPTLCDPMDCSTPGLPVYHQLLELLKLMSIESVMPSNYLILCCPLLLLPSNLPRIRVFSSESVLLIRWPKYWSFSFSISPFNEYSGLISFRIDWLDLFAFQGTLKSFLQHNSSKASILRHSAFFIVQLSHPSMTTGNHSLD